MESIVSAKQLYKSFDGTPNVKICSIQVTNGLYPEGIRANESGNER